MLKYSITPEIFIRYSYYIFEKSILQKRLNRLLKASFMIVILSSVAWLIELNNEILLWFVVFAPVVFLTLKDTLFLIPSKRNKILTQDIKKLMHEGWWLECCGERTLQLLQDAIIEITPKYTKKISYQIIDHIVEQEELIYLYLDTFNAVLIPNSAFSLHNRVLFLQSLNDRIIFSKK